MTISAPTLSDISATNMNKRTHAVYIISHNDPLSSDSSFVSRKSVCVPAPWEVDNIVSLLILNVVEATISVSRSGIFSHPEAIIFT